MIVMPACWSKSLVHYWAGRFPGHLGHLYSPGSQRGPYQWLPYALDNGRFPAWSAGKTWDEAGYIKMLEWAKNSGQPPLWALVPDVVTNREATLREWEKWSPVLREYGWPLAFAAQDGMTPADVPADASVVFIGGSTEWKWSYAWQFCEKFSRVHIGRVNTYGKLRHCQKIGAESCDGTGWTRGNQRQLDGLYKWLQEQVGERENIENLDLFAA